MRLRFVETSAVSDTSGRINESFSFSLTLEETKVHLIRTPEKSLLLFLIKIKNKSTKKPPVGTGGY